VSTLVTGDAVVLELPPAGLGTRTVSILIDVVLNVLLGVLAVWLFGFALTSLDAAAVAALTITIAVVVLVVLPATVETLTRGKSPGKYALGLRVVRDDGGPVRARQATTRALVGLGEIYLTFGALSAPFVLATHHAKRIGDMLAGTYVVAERTALVGGPMAQMPPHLAGWAASADLGQVPGRLSLAARSYLARAGTLSPAAREDLGNRLLGDLLQVVAPPPPPGTPREDVIAAVLAERRRRDLQRIEREQAQLARLRAMTDHARGD
jgi:uncharacterized RDD family membrane protein YckC